MTVGICIAELMRDFLRHQCDARVRRLTPDAYALRVRQLDIDLEGAADSVATMDNK